MRNTVKLVLFSVLVLAVLLVLPNISNAADGYSISLNYDPVEIVAGEEREASAVLAGTGAQVYPNVRIKVDIEGPATPVLLATDSNKITHDIAQIGYWGPETGFAVGGDFANTTPIKATFPKAGTYIVTLSLIDVNNGNASIVSEKFTIDVGLKLTTNIDGVEDTKFVSGGNTFESLQIADPEKDGYTFAGWYTDAEFTTPLDETAVLDESTTVYAKFDVAEDPTDDVTPPTDTTEDDTTVPSEEVEGEKDETPKTGVESFVGVAVAVIAIGTVSLVALKRKDA